MRLMQGENYFQLSASLKKPEELWIAKSDLIRLSLMTWIHLHIYPLYSNGDNVPCQQIFTTECLSPVFLAMTMRFFAGLYVAAHSSSHYRATSAIIICSITLSPSHGQPLSLARSLRVRPRACMGGWESFPSGLFILICGVAGDNEQWLAVCLGSSF